MIAQASLLVSLVELVARLPMPEPAAARRRRRPKLYSDQLMLRALVVMIIRHLHTPHELLSVLAQPTVEMQRLRALLTVDVRFPSRHTWERHLAAIPTTLPAQIA